MTNLSGIYNFKSIQISTHRFWKKNFLLSLAQDATCITHFASYKDQTLSLSWANVTA